MRSLIFLVVCFLLFNCEDKSRYVSNYDKVSNYSPLSFGPGLHHTLSVYEGSNIVLKNVQIDWFDCDDITLGYSKLIEKYTSFTKIANSGEVAIAYGDVWHSFFIKLQGESKVLIEITEWDDHLKNTDSTNFSKKICKQHKNS